mgnify:CR=1 FL=1
MRNSLLPSNRKNSPKSACRPERIGAGISTPVIVKPSEPTHRTLSKMKTARIHAANPCPNSTNTNPNSLRRLTGHPYSRLFALRTGGRRNGFMSGTGSSAKEATTGPAAPTTEASVNGPVVCRNAPCADNSFERNSLSLAVYLELRHERLERKEIHPRQRRPGT